MQEKYIKKIIQSWKSEERKVLLRILIEKIEGGYFRAF